MFLHIGHKGAAGYALENTLASFQKALDLSVDMIELDVHKSKSGEIVVIHDNTVDKMTNGKGKVGELTLKELKKLDVRPASETKLIRPMNGAEQIRKKGEIPTLREVLDLVDGEIKINIEIKAGNATKGVVKIIEEYVQKNYTYKSFLVSSFDYRNLIKVKLLNFKIPLGVITKRKLILLNLLFAQLVNAYSINILYTRVSKKVIKQAHALGLKVFVWTVNKPRDIKKMKKLGVDGIFSDYPDRI